MANASERVDILLKLTSQVEGGAESLEFLKSFASGLLGVGLAFGAAELGTKLAELVRSSTELGAQIGVMASRAELSTQAFQTLWLTSQRYGVTQEDIVRGSAMLQRNLETAARDGASPMAQHLEALRLSAAGLQALAPERQFEVLGERIANATDKHAAFAAAMELLGSKTAPKLLEYLKRLGVEGYDKLAEDVQKIELTDAQLRTLDEGAHHFERMATAAKLMIAAGFVQTVEAFSAALPPIVAAQQKMIELEAQAKGGGSNFAGALGLQILELNHARAEFAREATKAGGDGNLAAAGDAIAKMRKAGASGAGVDELEQALRAAYARREALKAQHLATEKKMDAAALAADLADLEQSDRKVSQKIAATDQKALASAIAATQKGMDEQNKKLEAQAEAFKSAADPAYALEVKLRELAAAQHAGFLSADEVAQATERLTFEFAGGFTPTIEAARQSLLAFQAAADAIAENPFLTNEEKHRQRVELLKQENAEIERRIAALRAEMALHPGVDGKGAQREIDSLSGREVGNKKELGAFDPAGAGIRDNLHANLVQLQTGIKTPAQNIAATISGTIGGAFQAVQRNVSGLLAGTESWHEALRNTAATIEGDLISGIVKMFTEWIEQRALAALANMTWSTNEGATDTAAKTPGALLTSISSYGAAAAIGVAALVAAMASIGTFEVGGFTDPISSNAIAGVVHGGEWVAPNWMVDDPRLGGVIHALEDERLGGSAGGAGGGGAFGAKPQRVIHVIAESKNHAKQLFNDPNFTNQMLAWTRRNLGLG